MNIVLFIIAWIILGIISTCIITRVAKQAISEETNNTEVDNDAFISAVADKAEDDQKLAKLLAHSFAICIVGIVLWPIVMPLALFGWNHINEL